MWECVLLCKVVWNGHFGAWDSLAWYKKAQEITEKVAQLSDESDYIFTSFVSNLAADMGEEHRLGQVVPSVPQRVSEGAVANPSPNRLFAPPHWLHLLRTGALSA